MLNKIPDVIYDKVGNRIRVIKVKEIFFKNQGKKGYILHIEREERITTISEFNLIEEDGRFVIDKDILGSGNEF